MSTDEVGAAANARSSADGRSRDCASASMFNPWREPPVSQMRAASSPSWPQSAPPSRLFESTMRHAAIRLALGSTKCSAARRPVARARLAARTRVSLGMLSGSTTAATASNGRLHGSSDARRRNIRLLARDASISMRSLFAAMPTVPAPGGTTPQLRQRSPMPSPATTTILGASGPAIRRASASARRRRIRGGDPHAVATAGGAARRSSRLVAARRCVASPPARNSHSRPLPRSTRSFPQYPQRDEKEDEPDDDQNDQQDDLQRPGPTAAEPRTRSSGRNRLDITGRPIRVPSPGGGSTDPRCAAAGRARPRQAVPRRCAAPAGHSLPGIRGTGHARHRTR